jgi:hypothetical protein
MCVQYPLQLTKLCMMVKLIDIAFNALKELPQSYFSLSTPEFETDCLALIENLTADTFNMDENDIERAQMILDSINNEKMYKMNMVVNSLQTFEDNILYYNYLHFTLYFEQHLM